MAKDSYELKQELEYILKGIGGKPGLESNYKRAKRVYDTQPKTGRFSAQIKKSYDYYKKEYDSVSARYRQVVSAVSKQDAKTRFEKSKQDAVKDKKSNKDKLIAAEQAVINAELLIKSQGRDKYNAALAARDALLPKSNTAEGNTNQADDYLGNYDTYSLNANGSVTAPGGNQVYIVSLPDPNDPNGEPIAQDFGSVDTARTAYVKAYASKPGGIDALKKQLINANYLTAKSAASIDWWQGLDDMIDAYTVSVVSSAKLGGAKTIQPITSFITMKSGGAGGTGGSKTNKYQVITTRGDAKRQLDEYLLDLRGSTSTPEELNEYSDELNKRESKAIRTEKDGVYTGSVLEESDRILIAVKVAKKSLGGMDVDALLSSSKGSRAALDITDLQSYASAYGIQMSASDALKYVVAGLGQTDYLKKQEERIRQLSMTMYPNLKDHITAGGTVMEVADQYARSKSNKLGVTIKTSTQDKDVMDALNSGKSIAQFDRDMQAKPEWGLTPEAHSITNDFTTTFLKSFGLVG